MCVCGGGGEEEVGARCPDVQARRHRPSHSLPQSPCQLDHSGSTRIAQHLDVLVQLTEPEKRPVPLLNKTVHSLLW